MIRYSRENPSPRYKELLAMYCTLHAEGNKEQGISADKMFSGISLPSQANRIKEMIGAIGAKTTLDYGCGKAVLYNTSPIQTDVGDSYKDIKAFWNVSDTFLYDPGYKPYSAYPPPKADLVICTDVLEHCPMQDVVWILKEIFSLANKGVYLNIAAHPAKTRLPNGENAHCTVRPRHWWHGALNYVSASFPDIAWQAWVDTMTNGQMQTVVIRRDQPSAAP